MTTAKDNLDNALIDVARSAQELVDNTLADVVNSRVIHGVNEGDFKQLQTACESWKKATNEFLSAATRGEVLANATAEYKQGWNDAINKAHSTAMEIDFHSSTMKAGAQFAANTISGLAAPEPPKKEEYVRTPRTLKQMAQMAMDLQDACNLSGIVHTFSDVMKDLRGILSKEENFSTEILNKHPICVLFTGKIASLTGYDISDEHRMPGINTFSDSYNWAQEITRND